MSICVVNMEDCKKKVVCITNNGFKKTTIDEYDNLPSGYYEIKDAEAIFSINYESLCELSDDDYILIRNILL